MLRTEYFERHLNATPWWTQPAKREAYEHPAQMRILEVLEQSQERWTNVSLKKFLGLAQSTVRNATLKLEDQGLIQRHIVEVPNDKPRLEWSLRK